MTIYTNEEQVTLGTNDIIINTPMLWVNAYLQSKLAQYVQIGVPFFPPSPNTINELTETWVVVEPETVTGQSVQANTGGISCTYDRLIRMRRSPFPHIKSEQLLYYFYALESGVTSKMVATTETVLRLMDREDETAEEINAWCKGRTIAGQKQEFYFHKFRVYQLEEVADIIDFGTARTYGGNKIIIEYEYHQMPKLTNS